MSCPYCHGDREGFFASLDRKGHVFVMYPNVMKFKFKGDQYCFWINYCPMCGMKLKKDGET